MISGVRASSIRMLSASSTRAKYGAALHGLLAAASPDAPSMPARTVALPFADPPQQQPVAEEVEAKLLGRAVGDVAGVGLAALVLRHLRLDHADASCPAPR